MATTGTITVDFGAAPGGNVATSTVTGQASILAGSYAEAWIAPTPTSDHSNQNLRIIDMMSSKRADTITPGTGFEVTLTSTLRLTGTVDMAWVGDF